MNDSPDRPPFAQPQSEERASESYQPQHPNTSINGQQSAAPGYDVQNGRTPDLASPTTGGPPSPYDYRPAPYVPASADSAPYVPVEPPGRRSGWSVALPIGITLLVLVGLSAVMMLSGQQVNFSEVGIIIPVAILAALAWGGRTNVVAAMFAYIWLAILALGVLFNSFGTVIFAYVADWGLLGSVITGEQSMAGVPLDQLFKPGLGAGLFWTLLLLGLSTVISAAMLLRPVRVLMARIMPIDPDNFVHKIALSFLTLVFLTGLVPLIVLGGRPPLLEIVNDPDFARVMGGSGFSVGPLDLLTRLVWAVPAVLIAAGWPFARNFRQSMERLGMMRPTLRQVVIGIGLGLGLVVAYIFVISLLIEYIWPVLGLPRTDNQAFEEVLLGRLLDLGVWGAVIIGVTAGISEEMGVRGLLQPRFGLIASNLIFTSVHAGQYGLDGLLVVFFVGFVIGIIRSRTNTTTSAITHAVYNFTLVMLAVFAAQFMEGR